MRILPIGTAAEPLLSPDLVWDALTQTGDLKIAPVSDLVGGLVARDAIATAVLICLQTDIRVDETELRDGDVNRGWPGDGFDLLPGEGPLGSKLWLLRRAAIGPETEIFAADAAREALQPLIDQGVAVRIDVSVAADRARGRPDLNVALYGRDGASVHQQRFAVLWDQLDGL